MIPVFQTLTTLNNGKGNCFIYCVASILELSLKELPDLTNDLNAGQFFLELEKWLVPRNLFPNHHAKEPQGYAIAGVYMGVEMIPHAIVSYNNRLVHDPHPLRESLSEPDAWWTLDPISEEQIPYCQKILDTL